MVKKNANYKETRWSEVSPAECTPPSCGIQEILGWAPCIWKSPGLPRGREAATRGDPG